MRDVVAGAHGLRATGRLTRSPFAGTLYPARLGVIPLFGDREYAVAASVEEFSSTPVLVSPPQRYRLLTELIATARTHMPKLTVILMRLGGPDFQVQLTTEMLEPDVLLTYDPEGVVPRLKAAGRKGILTVWHDIRIDGAGVGDNEISVAIHDAENALDFIGFVQASATMGGLSGLTFAPIG